MCYDWLGVSSHSQQCSSYCVLKSWGNAISNRPTTVSSVFALQLMLIFCKEIETMSE